MRDKMEGRNVKSQDLGLLLKLRAMEVAEYQALRDPPSPFARGDWTDWEFAPGTSAVEDTLLAGAEQDYTVRGLEMMTGISKSQINLSLKRVIEVGLVFRGHKDGTPRVNARALFEFIAYGARYVFPARKGEVTRGIGTAFSAPMLRSHLISAGELDLVWPDAYGRSRGQAVEPLFKSSPHAVQRDPVLYELLALVDAIRLGQPRERMLATELLEKRLVSKP